MTHIYKRIFGMVLICAVAVATGLSIGKIYLDMNAAPEGRTETEAELRATEAEVLELYNRSTGKSVTEFNAVEIWQIAEYKLSLQDKFKKEMTGRVVSAGVPVEMHSIKIKNGNVLTYDKLSPSKNVLGITTPNICSRITYNYNSPNQIYINKDGVFADPNASSEGLTATFSGKGDLYTKDQYYETFRTTPSSSVMPYIISDKTCDENSVSTVTDNGDGTYTFEINLSGENLEKAALYYSYEVLFSSGYSLPEWSNAKMTVTVDFNFLFQKIIYDENYTVYNAPVIGKAGVTDSFVDHFTYGDGVVA